MMRFADWVAGWPMALAVGDANSETEFMFPTSQVVGHRPITDPPGAGALIGCTGG